MTRKRMPAPTRIVGDAVVLGSRPMATGRTVNVSLAARAGKNGAEVVVVREANEIAQEREAYLDFVRCVHQRMLFAGAPRIHAAFGVGYKLHAVVEERGGAVNVARLREAIKAQSAHAPVGLALHLGEVVAHAFASLEADVDFHDANWPMEVNADDVLIGFDGAVRVLANPYPRWDERDGGAMVLAAPEPIQLGWTAPERIQGYRGTPHGEMYAVGVMMFELLAGRHPMFEESATAFERVRAIVEGVMPELLYVRRDIPPLVSTIVARCTQREARDRFGSWAELEASLKDAADRVDPFGTLTLAGMMTNLFDSEARATAAIDEEIGTLDVPALLASGALPSDDFDAIPLASLNARHWRQDRGVATPEERTQVFFDVATFGADARPMFRAGDLLVDAHAVTNAEYARFAIACERAAPSQWAGTTPPLALLDLPVSHVSHDDALAYARWARKRLPTSDEWTACVAGVAGESGGRLGTGAVWEWTTTPMKSGFVVRGGRYRDRLSVAPAPSNVAWEDAPAADVGFRCIASAAKDVKDGVSDV